MAHLPIVQRVDPGAHAAAFIALRSSWDDENGRTNDDPTAFTAEFTAWLERESLHRKFWLLRLDDEPVGMVNLLFFERMPSVGRPAGGWGYLCNMFVRSDHRSAGYGASLAGAVVDYADANGLERIVLNPTERSRPFYASLGFNAVGERLLLRTP